MKVIELNGIVGLDFDAAYIKWRLPTKGDVEIRISSPGGFIFDAFDIFNLLKEHDGKVRVVVGALAASAASYIILAADEIAVHENSSIMIHRAWNLSIGNSVEMRKHAEILEGLDFIAAKEYSKRTGITVDAALEEMTAEKWMIGAESIIDAGFADDVFVKEKDYDEEQMEKAEIVARMQAVKAELEKHEEIYEKAAACIKNMDVPAHADTDINEEENADMKLSEYLESNPEAKAEYNSSIETAKAEAAKAKNEETLTEERERVMEVLAIAGVKLSESATAVIKSGGDAKDYAFAEMKKQQRANAQAGDTNLGNFDTGAQEPKDTVTDEDPEKKAVSAWDSAVDQYLGKKKEAK